MKDYVLAAIAGIWLADGLSLLIAPRFVVERLREALQQQPSLWTWQWLSVMAGTALLTAGWSLPLQPLWLLTALAMIGKGTLLAAGPGRWREKLVSWGLSREDVDYRFVGLGLCALAVLLLHALGWLPHNNPS
ncbi:MAG: hypothetical protein U0412_11640 [Nitrospira sp.]